MKNCYQKMRKTKTWVCGTPSPGNKPTFLVNLYLSAAIYLLQLTVPGLYSVDSAVSCVDSSASVLMCVNCMAYSRWTGVMKESDDDADTTLNIFSLASGHLYERFLRYVGAFFYSVRLLSAADVIMK